MYAIKRGRVAVMVALSVPSVSERVRSIGGEEASAVRALIWSQGVRVIADHPLGAGLGNYSRLVGRYYDTVDPGFNVRTYPHSVVLAAWAETGPVGLLGLLYAWAAFALLCVEVLRRGATAGKASAAAGLFCVAAFWTVGLTHDVLYHNAVAFAFFGMMGWVLAENEQEDGG